MRTMRGVVGRLLREQLSAEDVLRDPHLSGAKPKPIGITSIEAEIAQIHPRVLAASEDELIAAGWGDMQRKHIPADWERGRSGKRSAKW